MDPQLEEGQTHAPGTLGNSAGRTERRRWARGRHAAPAPDGKDLPAKLIALVRQRFSYLNDLFNALPDRRSPDDCLYTTATILWMVVLGFLCRKGTRNAMDVDRNTGMAPSNLLALSGQRRWPTGRSVTAPCPETATRLLDILAPGKLEEIVLAVAAAGRSRSRIEESYNVQKNGGFGLEHAFRETDRGAANYHLLMQLAHNLWQLLVKGWVRREMAACRKLTDVCLAKLLAAALHLCGPPVEPFPAFQIRFADG